MRISQGVQDKSSKVLLVLISPLLLAVVAAIIPILAIMWCKRAVVGPHKNWSRWFAWHPVNLGEWFEPDWRWLEIVERKSWSLMDDVQYRPLPTPESGESV